MFKPSKDSLQAFGGQLTGWLEDLGVCFGHTVAETAAPSLFGPNCVPSMLSSYAFLEMILRNYFYGGICIVEHSNTLIPRVSVKAHLRPTPRSPKDNGSF